MSGEVRRLPEPRAVSRAAVSGLLVTLLLCTFARQAFGWGPGEWLDLVPDCAFRSLTGFPCPGCGMTRSLLLLTELRLADAVAMNPGAPVLVAAMGAWLVRPPAWQARSRDVAAAAALGAVLLVWALRCSSIDLRLPL